MLTIQSKIETVSSYPLQYPYTWEDVIFFDIETTGFSANTSFLYLIGCMYYKENTWQMIQWLADDMNSEAAILNAFFNTLKSFKRLVHFNGSGFDIPYILKKCKKYHIQDSFQAIESFDIYKKLLPYRKLLPLPDCKLKTIEKFVGLEREDCYSGEELIQIYANYLGRIQYERLHQKVINNQKSMMNCQISKALPNDDVSLSTTLSSEYFSHIFLLHNLEDVKGLLQVADILYYNFEEIDIVPKDSCIEEERWILTFTLANFPPYSVSWRSPLLGTSVETSDTCNNSCEEKTLQLSVAHNQLTLIVPIYQGELKYFYDNYKDYYYLPKEDMAIHKSVAQYVDKDFRMRAKASNCYTKKFSSFVPQFEEPLSPSFKAKYNDKLSYIETTNTLFNQPSTLYQYTKTLIHYIFTNKETVICSKK